MGNIVATMSAAVAEALEPDEVILFAIKAAPGGAYKKRLTRGLPAIVGGGLVGGAIGVALGRTGTTEQERNAVRFPLAKEMTVGVTAQRVLVATNSFRTGRPSNYVGSVPLTNISTCSHYVGWVGPMRILEITFRLRNGEQRTLGTRVSRRGKTFASEAAYW